MEKVGEATDAERYQGLKDLKDALDMSYSEGQACVATVMVTAGGEPILLAQNPESKNMRDFFVSVFEGFVEGIKEDRVRAMKVRKKQ